MNTDQRLAQVAEQYRVRGYDVLLRPTPEALPDFAKDFNAEIMAIRDDGSVLASAKRSQSDLVANHEIPRYADVTSKQPGWRFDVIVMDAENQFLPAGTRAREPSEEAIDAALRDVDRLLETGFVQQSMISAWAVLETAMRRTLEANGEEARTDASPRTMLNELYSDGVLDRSVFRDLETSYQVRRAIDHGFITPHVHKGEVEFLVNTARTLLDSSTAVKEIA